MIIKGLAGDVAFLHNILHRQLSHFFIKQQRFRRVGNGLAHILGHVRTALSKG